MNNNEVNNNEVNNNEVNNNEVNNNKVNYIPFEVTCPMASCSRSNTCARYARYQNALSQEATFCVMNPKLLKLGGDTCPYHLVVEKQRWAWGFQRIYDTIPAGHTYKFNECTPYTVRRYYKAKNGEIPIEPEMQAQLLAIFKRNGADTSLGFDRYEEREVLVEK